MFIIIFTKNALNIYYKIASELRFERRHLSFSSSNYMIFFLKFCYYYTCYILIIIYKLT